MNILDCVTYFDEELILELRLNILYEHVTCFIITEGKYDHRGNERELNFDIKKYKKFKDKIVYIPVENFPNLKNPWHMLEFQRNYSMNEINNYDDNTYILVSDIDEIPNPEKINEFIKNDFNYGVFEQLFFYYKLNLLNTSQSKWYGSKICKKKNLRNPNWLREYKIKQYPWWRIDKPENLKIIKNGGWHFSFLYDVEGIIKKISSFQHTEFDKEEFKNKEIIKQKIKDGKDIFNRNFFFKKVNIDEKFPKFLVDNKDIYKNWIQE